MESLIPKMDQKWKHVISFFLRFSRYLLKSTKDHFYGGNNTLFNFSVFVVFYFLWNFTTSVTLSRSPVDQSNDIRTHLMRVAAEISDQAFSQYTTLEEWTSVKEKRHQQFIEMMGLYDVPLEGDRPPLNVKIVDTLQMEGYRIVKLYYESLPQLYVPADLYIPDNIEKPRPAVLYI